MTLGKKIINLLAKWRFGFLLGLCLIALQAATLLIIILSAPEGTTWLGGISAYNFHDIAVYINYLEQSKHSLLITNLYNNLPQIPRFDAFWSISGQLTYFKIPAKFAHEILRYLATLVLAITFYWIAKKQTQTEPHARLATIFMLCGMSTGILNLIWQNVLFGPDVVRFISPDLDSDFAIAPTLFAGAHVILSIALQFISIYHLWQGIEKQNFKKTLIAGITSLYLTSFHPYFIPLLGLISLMAIFAGRNNIKKRIKLFLFYNLFLIPPACYYIYLLQDSAFQTHHFTINQLPLAHPVFWIITLLPFIAAISWQKYNKIKLINQQNLWAWSWIAAAIFCMLLPFPWTRKYTQALLPALIITTLPFWLHFADKLLKQSKWFIKPLLALGIALPYLVLFQNTLAIIDHPKWKFMIYQPNGIMQAYKYLKTNSKFDDLILTDNLWSNIWLPAYTNRHIWIGHSHETPEYESRLQAYKLWLTTKQSDEFNTILNHAKINYLITQKDFTDHTQNIINDSWHPVWTSSQITVWKRTD